MITYPLGRCELFQLGFLRLFSLRFAGRAYALKGGVCLRFFHRSARLSQGMELDVTSQARGETVQRAVESILKRPSFLASLVPNGMVRFRVTHPKQTETTQRWKVALHFGREAFLSTKIELTRRRERIPYASGVPSAELLARYEMVPFASRFYGAVEMAAQKIRALASPCRYALRDLFDLHHLVTAAGVVPTELIGRVEPEEVERAAEKVKQFTHAQFKEQVVPYLTETMMDHYKPPAAFKRLKEEVERALVRGVP